MNINVTNLQGNCYKVTGEGIDVEVKYYWYDSKITGKGARKYKEEIEKAVRSFVETKQQEECRQAKEEAKEEQRIFRESEAYKTIELLGLYKATFKYYDSSMGWMNHQSLLTGYEVKAERDVVAIEKVDIQNTDLFSIGGGALSSNELSRKSLVDKRIIPHGFSFYVTGLGLKELLLEGFVGHGGILKVEREDHRYATVMNKAVHECQRATSSSEEVQPKKEYTKDKEEIQYNWFSSKPCGFKDLEDLYVASYSRYVIKKSISVDAKTFEQFKESLEMNLLNDYLEEPFQGGSSSTVDLGTDKEVAFYELSEVVQAQYIEGCYTNALEVKCEDPSYDYSLLIDPSGYDYARYAGIRHLKTEDESLKEKESNVIDFAKFFNKRKEEQEMHNLEAEFINEILPTLSFEQKVEMANLIAGDVEQFKEFILDCYLKYKIEKLIKA